MTPLFGRARKDARQPSTSGPRVTLVGRQGCHLCDQAREVIAEVTQQTGETFEEISLDDHPELPAEYAEMIPVTLVDGRQHDYWRVDPQRLQAALRRRTRR